MTLDRTNHHVALLSSEIELDLSRAVGIQGNNQLLHAIRVSYGADGSMSGGRGDLGQFWCFSSFVRQQA
jgi:hypothetical protein